MVTALWLTPGMPALAVVDDDLIQPVLRRLTTIGKATASLTPTGMVVHSWWRKHLKPIAALVCIRLSHPLVWYRHGAPCACDCLAPPRGGPCLVSG